jgi:hypothetical protein
MATKKETETEIEKGKQCLVIWIAPVVMKDIWD